jgi:low affinity Fe/Cu permease
VDVFLLFLLSDLPLPEDLLGRVITFLTFPIFLWKVLINTTLLRYALSWNFTYAFTLAIVHVSMVVFLGGAIASGLEG